MLEQLGAHHRRQREGNDGGNEDGDAQGDRKFPEEPADDVAHEQQRDENGDQRDGEGHDGEPDLLGPFERGLKGRFALLEVTVDVLDHHDRVVHDETGGDGQRH